MRLPSHLILCLSASTLGACSMVSRLTTPSGAPSTSSPAPSAPTASSSDSPVASDPVAVPIGPAAALPSGRPSWCGSYHGDTGRSPDGQDYNVDMAQSLGRTLCGDASSDERAAAKQAWSKWTAANGMSEADMADLGAILSVDYGPLDPQNPNERFDADTAQVAKLDPVDEMRYVQAAAGKNQLVEFGWILDGLPHGVHQPARVAFLEQCFDAIKNGSDNTEHKTEKYAVWALCKGDVAALSRKQLDADLAASKADAATRFAVRARFGRVSSIAAHYEAQMEAAAKQDPQIKKLIDDVPAAATKSWTQTATKYKDLFARLFALEDALRSKSRQALAGCHDKFWSYWQQAANTIEPDADHWASAMRSTPEGQAAALGLALCHVESLDEHDRGPAYELAMHAMEAGYGDFQIIHVRGIHTAIYAALASNAQHVKFDDRSLGDGLELPHYGDGLKSVESESHHDEFVGSIDAVTTHGETATVTFKHTSYKRRICTDQVSTGHIERISSDGTFVYFQHCNKWETKTFDGTTPPVDIPAFMAAGLKPGRVATFNGTQVTFQAEVEVGHKRPQRAHRKGDSSAEPKTNPAIPIIVTDGNKVIAFVGVLRR
jgi:hypothetical protein